MAKEKRIITGYMLHNYPESVQREFAEWFSAPHSVEEKDAVLAEQWQSINQRADRHQVRSSYEAVTKRIRVNQSRVRRTIIFRSVLQAAAVIILAVALVMAVKTFVTAEKAVEWQEVYVANGQSRTVTLSDGSVLRLAAGSRLIYPSSFEGDVRRVYLSGEAYADIAKDELRRFVIAAEQVDVVVHGTRFNVRSYDANSEVELMLFDGAVDMQTKALGQNRIVNMRPGDFIKFDKRSGRVSYESIPKDMFDDEPQAQTLTFINSRLGDIAMQLERLFNVRIIIDKASLAEERYYSAFVNNESLDRILSTFERNGRIAYYWKNGTIHLTNK